MLEDIDRVVYLLHKIYYLFITFQVILYHSQLIKTLKTKSNPQIEIKKLKIN